jgi:hypothetical protein
MTDDFQGEMRYDAAEVGDIGGRSPFGDLPVHIDVLPESGREVVVLGDVEGCKELNHHQGDNPYGFQGTCGLVSCEDVLRQFGFEVTEGDVVRHALIADLCNQSDDPAECGGTSMYGQTQILVDGGLAAHPVVGAELGDLAGWVGEGRGVIVEVNAGELWDDTRAMDNGGANHAIVVTGAALDPESGALVGFYINDSGRGYPADSGRFVSIDLMQRAWAEAGGGAVITDTMRVGRE